MYPSVGCVTGNTKEDRAAIMQLLDERPHELANRPAAQGESMYGNIKNYLVPFGTCCSDNSTVLYLETC